MHFIILYPPISLPHSVYCLFTGIHLTLPLNGNSTHGILQTAEERHITGHPLSAARTVCSSDNVNRSLL